MQCWRLMQTISERASGKERTHESADPHNQRQGSSSQSRQSSDQSNLLENENSARNLFTDSDSSQIHTDRCVTFLQVSSNKRN